MRSKPWRRSRDSKAEPKVSQSHSTSAQLGHLEAVWRLVSLMLSFFSIRMRSMRTFVPSTVNTGVLLSLTAALINYGTTVNGCHTSSGLTASHQTLNKLFSHLLSPITWNSILVFSSPSSATLQEATKSGRRDPNLWEWLQFSVSYFSLFYYLRL